MPRGSGKRRNGTGISDLTTTVVARTIHDGSVMILPRVHKIAIGRLGQLQTRGTYRRSAFLSTLHKMAEQPQRGLRKCKDTRSEIGHVRCEDDYN